MSMILMQLNTHWNADEAETIIDFLDNLRDVLLAAYAQEIQDAKKREWMTKMFITIARTGMMAIFFRS